jgi:hypothetical protein
VLITGTPTLESPNPSKASILDTDYDKPHTTEEYGIGIFDLFAWLDTRDARSRREIKCKAVKATAAFNNKTLFAMKWT